MTFGRVKLLVAVDGLARHGPASVDNPLALLWPLGRLVRGERRLTPWPVFRAGVGHLQSDSVGGTGCGAPGRVHDLLLHLSGLRCAAHNAASEHYFACIEP